MTSPGFGFRHPKLASLLASRTPAATGSMSWVNGTMPLSVAAKMIMAVEGVVSLVTIGLVISRAVNIL